MSRRNKARELPPFLPERADNFFWEWDAEEEEAAIVRERSRNERHRQNSLAKLKRLDAKFEQQEREYRLHRIAALESLIAADRSRLAEIAEKERRLKAIDEQQAKEDRQRRERAAQQLKVINKDMTRRERSELERRGVVRGKR